MCERKQLAEAVSEASAAILFNVLPALIKLPASECHERLRVHFATALSAYHQGLRGWDFPTPSRN